MLPARFAKTFETVIKLLGSIARRVEPGVLFERQVAVDTAHGEHLPTTHPLEQVFFSSERPFSFAQALDILLQQTVGNLTEGRFGERHRCHERLGHMPAQQRPHLGLVARSHHTLENIIVLGLHLPAVADIAANQEKNRQRHDNDHRNHTAVVDGQRKQERRHESRTGRNEPAANHGNHTRNAEYGALAAPGPVSQRRTHRHHKGHVSSRKRQLE